MLLLFWGAVISAAAEENLIDPVTEPVTEIHTEEPVTLWTTEPVPTEHTLMPTITAPPTEEPTKEHTEEPTELPTVPVGGGKGYIDTYCNVDGAAVSLDGRYGCMIAQGVCTIGVSPTGHVSTVTVSKAGYLTWSGALSHMPADQEHVAVYATLNPVPTQTTIPPVQKGAVYAQSYPAGAAIYLNGNFQGYSPLTIPNLPPGTYSMKASLSGYTPDTQLIDVYAGQTSTYYPTLQPSPLPPRNTGTVSVISSPNAALVYADGTYQGKTPITVTLYPGTHSFRVSLPGYNDYSASVYVSANSNQNLNAVLTTAILGTVTITSLPGANVWMDSNPQGKIPSTGTLALANVASGNHVFKISAAGYNDWINTVYVQSNAVTPISVTLTPSGGVPTPVPATGGLNIASTPSGAEIFLDNLFRGYTPAVIDGLSAGQHQVLLKYTSYIDYTTTTTVVSGQTAPLAIGLQPAPTPTPKSAPSPVVLIGGLALILGIGAALWRRT